MYSWVLNWKSYTEWYTTNMCSITTITESSEKFFFFFWTEFWTETLHIVCRIPVWRVNDVARLTRRAYLQWVESLEFTCFIHIGKRNRSSHTKAVILPSDSVWHFLSLPVFSCQIFHRPVYISQDCVCQRQAGYWRMTPPPAYVLLVTYTCWTCVPPVSLVVRATT